MPPPMSRTPQRNPHGTSTTPLLRMSGEGENLELPCFFGANLCVPLAAVANDGRHIGIGFDDVDGSFGLRTVDLTIAG
jgi:hypothetical protein